MDHPHRWSGWPGAWCLDCGASDRREDSLLDSDHPLECDGCELCENPPCPEPNSNKYNPYGRKK